MGVTMDRDWHIGVPGWKIGDRHVRLREVIEHAPARREPTIREHLNAMLLLWLVLHKMRDELEEAEEWT